MVAGIDVPVDLLSPIGLSASNKANNMQRDTFHLGGQSGWLRATVGTQTDGTEDCAAKHSVTVGTQTDGIVTADTETNKRIVRFEEQSDQLLPGIPNETTFSEIAPKLPWSAIRTLSFVSRGWLQAVRSRHACSSESLVVLNHTRSEREFEEDKEAISLYSMRDNRCYRLPRLSLRNNGIPEYCACASVDGRIYIIRGDFRLKSLLFVSRRGNVLYKPYECGSVEAHVLDMTGKGQWKQCAHMGQDRKDFGCGVMNGKIYVFGGCNSFIPDCPLRDCEVYDPEADTWLSIQPMRSFRLKHSVVAIGEELFVYGGYCYKNNVDPTDDDHRYLVTQSAEAYHPVRNEWRVIEPFKKDTKSRLFSAQGKIYSMTCEGISVHANDLNEDTWTDMHSFSLPQAFEPPDEDDEVYLAVKECPVLAVDDELLTIWRWHTSVKDTHLSLLRSKGFGSKKKEIVWEKANCPHVWDILETFNLGPTFLCPAQI